MVALIMKSKNDAGQGIVHGLTVGNKMEVDSSPTSTNSSKSSVNIKNDGIDIDTEHLERSELVQKLINKVHSNSIVLLTSPAGSGKSSLYKLYKVAATDKKVIGISCFKDKTLFELLKAKGIDYENEIINEKLLSGKDVVVFLDDAQAKYADTSFWEEFAKAAGLWLPKNIKFIVSATHSLNGGKESPVEFESLPRLSRNDFLLSDEEAYQFLDFSDIGLPEKMKLFPDLKAVLVKESGGLIASLRLAVDSHKDAFMQDMHPTETTLLHHCFSNNFVQRMARCFGSRHSKPVGDDFKNFLKRCFSDDRTQLNGLMNQEDNDSYSSLKKAGILVEFPDTTFGFSSPLAKRYYFKWIFPNRSLTAPSTLAELIGNVVSSMSATILKNSTRPGDFPKEAVFQHLFMEGLASFTPPNCSICPELSKIFSATTNPNTQQTIHGEIDFYLNSSLRWGIELLVNGDGIGEHISRFTPPNGKYVALAVSDYTVVDIRRNSTGRPTNISRHSNRITVFFKNDDYSIAQCILGLDNAPVVISLSN
jgi:energy-coupling factor transporter ATP-binding protein EcfA2